MYEFIEPDDPAYDPWLRAEDYPLWIGLEAWLGCEAEAWA